MERQSKEVDFKEIVLGIKDFVDNESFESVLESFGIERTEENCCSTIVLTVVKIEVL